MRLKDNKDGESKKLLLEQERQCKLSTSLFMFPSYTGIKPHDVLLLPNLSGTYFEDWIVNTVEYSQTDGGVTLSVQASRKFGLGEPMNPTITEPWLNKINGTGVALPSNPGATMSWNLTGQASSLESWVDYAYQGWPLDSSPGVRLP
jgi:hypothetical protein